MKIPPRPGGERDRLERRRKAFNAITEALTDMEPEERWAVLEAVRCFLETREEEIRDTRS